MFAKSSPAAGKIIRSLAIVFILFSASACSEAESSVTPTAQPAIFPTETGVIPTSTQTSRPTADLSTATSTAEMTSWANEACWEEKSLEDADANLSGSLLYQDFQSKEYRLLDFATRTTRGLNLFGNFFTQIQVSPYGQYFSILRSASNELVLFSEHGGKIFLIPPKTYFLRFLNSSQILLGYEETDDGLYVLNPLSGETKPIVVSKPHLQEEICWDGGFKCLYRYTTFSPNLKYVFYMADNNNTNYLLNIESGELVENKADGYSFGKALYSPDKPVWKLDSSAVTIFDSFNYYNINIDGEYTQLTHLENLLSYYSLKSGIWSPTGRYLAFMTFSDGNISLFVFDSHTNTLINTCLSEPLDGRHYHWPMYWSPVGDHLAVNIGGTGAMNPYGRGIYAYDEWYKTKIIDIEHQMIYELSSAIQNDQQILVGWLSWELP